MTSLVGRVFHRVFIRSKLNNLVGSFGMVASTMFCGPHT